MYTTMIKSIFTIIFIASLHLIGFAQQETSNTNVAANLALVSTSVEEKSDITGTISNIGGFNMFVDDAKVDFDGKVLKSFSDKNLEALIQKGYSHILKAKSKNACYRYRISTKEDGSQEMSLYDCPF